MNWSSTLVQLEPPRLISCLGTMSCAWSSTTLRRKRRLSRWVCGSQRWSWRACGWRKSGDGRPPHPMRSRFGRMPLPVDETRSDCAVWLPIGPLPPLAFDCRVGRAGQNSEGRRRVVFDFRVCLLIRSCWHENLLKWGYRRTNQTNLNKADTLP